MRVCAPLAEAASLASRLNARCILPSDPSADLAALAPLAEHCEKFSPLVGWETAEGQIGRCSSQQQGSPDSLLLDVTGIGPLFHGEESLANEVITDLRNWGCHARVAIAETIGAAWALATEGAVNPAVVPSTRMEPTIAPLPLSALRLPRDTIDLLAQLGVVRVEQLLHLPRTSLPARFGQRLLRRLDQLLGAAPEVIVPHRPPAEFAAEEVLEHPAESREVVEHVVRELAKRLAAALAPRRQGAMRLSCRLDSAPGRPLTWQVGLYRPSADPRHFWDLLRVQLEQTALSGPVGRLTLAAPLTAPLENRQGELFAGSSHDASRQLDLLVDRLSSRLGAKAVLRPELTADPLPERAVRYVPLVESGSKRRMSKSPLHAAAACPLTLHSPPRALEVVSIVPDGPPVSFRFGSQAHRVACWWGPERIETGWWRGRSVRRDYYRIETADGQRLWLFRRLEDGAWFLHGEFA